MTANETRSVYALHGNVKELSISTVRSKLAQLHAFLKTGETRDAPRIEEIKAELHVMIDNYANRETRERKKLRDAANSR